MGVVTGGARAAAIQDMAEELQSLEVSVGHVATLKAILLRVQLVQLLLEMFPLVLLVPITN